MTATPPSLRRRLFWRLVPALLTAIAVGGVTSYFVARHSADFAYDQALGAAAADIASGVELVDGRPAFALSRESERILRSDERDDIYFSVWRDDDVFVGGDRDLALSPLAFVSDPVSTERTFRGRTVRAVSLPFARDGVPFVVVVAETMRKRHAAALTAFAQMVTPTTLVLLVACLIVWVSVRAGLAPLAMLESEIETRSEHDLSAIDPVGAPREVSALVRALNGLLARLEAATRTHQAFVADAAHQLRTPLAGIQMHVDLLALDAGEARDPSIERLREATARAVRLSNQLLALARSDKDARALALQDFDLADLVGDAADGWVGRAIAAGIDLGFELVPGRLNADPSLLRELLDNLVDNAILYTPAGGTITISTAASAAFVEIRIDDSGPGIPVEWRERVFERFCRADAEHGGGSGLGLAIVRQIVTRHGGDVAASTSTSLGGARLTVRLPRAASRTTPIDAIGAERNMVDVADASREPVAPDSEPPRAADAPRPPTLRDAA